MIFSKLWLMRLLVLKLKRSRVLIFQQLHQILRSRFRKQGLRNRKKLQRKRYHASVFTELAQLDHKFVPIVTVDGLDRIVIRQRRMKQQEM